MNNLSKFVVKWKNIVNVGRENMLIFFQNILVHQPVECKLGNVYLPYTIMSTTGPIMIPVASEVHFVGVVEDLKIVDIQAK